MSSSVTGVPMPAPTLVPRPYPGAVRALVVGNANDFDSGFVGSSPARPRLRLRRVPPRASRVVAGARRHRPRPDARVGVERLPPRDGLTRRGGGRTGPRHRRPGHPAAGDLLRRPGPVACPRRHGEPHRHPEIGWYELGRSRCRQGAVDGVARRRVHGAGGVRRARQHRRRTTADPRRTHPGDAVPPRGDRDDGPPLARRGRRRAAAVARWRSGGAARRDRSNVERSRPAPRRSTGSSTTPLRSATNGRRGPTWPLGVHSPNLDSVVARCRPSCGIT